MGNYSILLRYIASILLLSVISYGLSFYSPVQMRIQAVKIDEKNVKPIVQQDQPLPDLTIDYLIVFKAKRQMRVFHNGQLVKIYPIALGFNPIGHKQFEGDGKTPEGLYYINDRNPNSAYHKNLAISYPNEQDKLYAQSKGKSAGGAIKIHGLKNGLDELGRLHLAKDWTHGCIAVTNEQIDELYRAVTHNAIIDIRP